MLALGCLGTGSVWTRRGAGSGFQSGHPAMFVAGFVLIVVAAALCWFAIGRAAGRPHPPVCAAAIGMQVLVPAYAIPIPLMWVTGIVLATVPLIGRRRAAWAPVVVAAALVTWGAISHWAWGYGGIDVFDEVQGSTAALLRGQNPYSPVYSIYLDSPLHHVVRGAASFNYGPVVVLVSVPARLLGDIRVTMAVLNVAILVALLTWSRRATADLHLLPTIAALWLASPFIPLMILYAWTDSVSMAGMAWWLVLRDRHRNWSTLVLAVTLASKPTFLPLVIPLVFWVRSTWREFLWATGGAVLIVAPFALWTGVAQFVYDTVLIFGDLPARRDAVGLNGLSTALGGGLLPPSLLLGGTVVTVLAFTLRRPRDYADLLLAGAGMLVVVYFFAKQAFINYDFNAAMTLLFVIGAGSLLPATPLSHPVDDLRLAGARLLRRQSRTAVT